ncbi:MAG: ABC transporter permease [Clostridiales bacterium]|nr:ABC transporter permease [Clostridiales bacterium]
MKNNKLRSVAVTILSALLCVVIGLVIGFAVLVGLSYASRSGSGAPFTFADVINDAYTKGFQRVLMGGWYGSGRVPRGIRSELAQAAPLIMTGLSVAFAFKTGLFNIGAAGQYAVGAFGALVCALVLKLPWYLCLIAAAVFGALWGAIPGIFKAYFNVNEVITAIMFNWIGLYGVNTILYGGGHGVMFNEKTSKTWAVAAKSSGSLIPDLKDLGANYIVRPATVGIFIAILIAVALWVILNKTTFGYELKACGFSKSAAKYAGINEKKNIILSMTISGALAGIGAGMYYLSDAAQWEPMVSTVLPAFGFDGISVALLASSHPLGTILSALFISHISTGGGFMDAMIFPPEIADVISGVIIYLCAFMMLFKNKIARLLSRKEKGGLH